MKIYLLRHGLAVARGQPETKEDSARPLTAEGEEKTRRVARGLARLGATFDVLLTSPYLRARQTAEIVAGVFKARKRLVILDELAPGGTPRAVMDRIRREYVRLDSALLVGHEPGLSELASLLLTGSEESILLLKKGGCCRLECETPRYGKCAVLEFLLTPRQLIGVRAGK
jgi:phosphohistidine phosphatase